MIYEKHTKCKVKKWWISEIQFEKVDTTIFCFFEDEVDEEDQIILNTVKIVKDKETKFYECSLSDTSFSDPRHPIGKFSDYNHLGVSQGHMVLAGTNKICYIDLLKIISKLEKD
jgi:hypothetical protein